MLARKYIWTIGKHYSLFSHSMLANKNSSGTSQIVIMFFGTFLWYSYNKFHFSWKWHFQEASDWLCLLFFFFFGRKKERGIWDLLLYTKKKYHNSLIYISENVLSFCKVEFIQSCVSFISCQICLYFNN